ncbi:MAG: NUDIX domain-containing protein [Chitinophagaceae bacterium]|nr:NUDIX domain-containing protein [Chitinophagaceae bacterium]
MNSKVAPGLKRTAVLCVLRHADRFLLLRRLKEPNRDKYTPVGGKLDPFESPLDAALRETWEETGIRVEHMRYAGVLVETSPTDYNWTGFVYVASIDDIPPPPCNEGTLEWIALDEVLQVPTPPTDWFIYQYIVDGRPFAFHADYDAELQLLRMTEELEGISLVPAPVQ